LMLVLAMQFSKVDGGGNPWVPPRGRCSSRRR